MKISEPTAEGPEVFAEERGDDLTSVTSAKTSAISAIGLCSLVILVACLTCLQLPARAQQNKRDPRYPAHWWAPINDRNKPDWEILPQEAGPGEVILSKRNELGLLSNFAPTPFVFHGKRYESLEGFWQAMLYPEGPNDPRAKFPGLKWKYTRAEVERMTAFDAKTAGDLAEENMRKMGIGWVSFEGKRFAYRSAKRGRHYQLIVAATWAKVNQSPKVKEVLLATGDLILKPDHHQGPNAPPEWRYFEIWTKIRARLQKR